MTIKKKNVLKGLKQFKFEKITQIRLITKENGKII